MTEIINLYKPIGVTPFQLLTTLREVYPKYAQSKLGYIGKLDPLAHGVMVVMIDEANQQIDRLKGHNKRYECHFILGVATDTYDILGKVRSPKVSEIQLLQAHQKVYQVATRIIGTFKQPYPPYSGVKVNGKPLFEWARSNQLVSVTIPSKLVTVYDINIHARRLISTQVLQQEIRNRINLVKGDFRQREINQIWTQWFKTLSIERLPLYSLTMECSSGTFVRSIINQIGEELQTGATVFEICRTAVGSYSYQDAINLSYGTPNLYRSRD